MMAVQSASGEWIVEEYLSYEAESGIKHEYIDGQIYAMIGGSEHHSLISANAITTFSQGLRDTNCRVHTSDMRVQISESKYVYPNFSVVCGEAVFADANRTMLTNPVLVGEVLSPSSADYDRGSKANFYRSLDSLQIYLLLDQTQVTAQLYTRHNAGWLLREFDDREATLLLNGIDIALPLADLYRDIHFS